METLRAFLNICRHRHHPVVQGAGNKAALKEALDKLIADGKAAAGAAHARPGR
jgi:hypothetical protein